MDPMYLNNLFYKQEMKYNLRDNTLLEQPKFSTKTYGYRSFIYYGSTLWNALPFEITNTDSYDDFKLKLKAGVTKVISINLINILILYIQCTLDISRQLFAKELRKDSP